MKIAGCNLERDERKIFFLHIIYSLFEGTTLGVLVLNEFVFIKSLHGTNMQLGLLIQFSMMVFVLSAIIHQVIKRYKKSQILKITALITRLPLLLFFFFPRMNIIDNSNLALYHIVFLLIFLFYFLASPVVYPIINSILKNNYKSNHFGKLYSYSTTTNKIMMLLSTFLFGWLLDVNNNIYIYIYPILGIFGITSLFLFSKAVKIEYIDEKREKKSLKISIKDSIHNMIDIVKFNKPYRDFEIGFMLYGIAFMITYGIITIFLVQELNLNYTSIAFYKNSYNVIAILTLPFFGKLIDKIDPRKFGGFAFFTLLLHLVFLALTEYFPYHFDIGNYRFYYLLIISFSWNGLFAATMSLLWNIGSAYFCKLEETANYQSLHLTFVGMRAMLAPLFGIWLYKYIGFTGVFVIGILFVGAAIWVMFYSIKKYKLELKR